LLAGCRGSSDDPLLLSARGELPPAWVKALPKPWRLQPLDSPAAVLEATMQGPGAPAAALLQLSDGWAADLPPSALQPIGTAALLARLDPLAGPVSRLFRAASAPALAFPWAVNPWVLVLRDRPDLARRRAAGWDLLLPPVEPAADSIKSIAIEVGQQKVADTAFFAHSQGALNLSNGLYDAAKALGAEQTAPYRVVIAGAPGTADSLPSGSTVTFFDNPGDPVRLLPSVPPVTPVLDWLNRFQQLSFDEHYYDPSYREKVRRALTPPCSVLK
jgi:hypothetical protein